MILNLSMSKLMNNGGNSLKADLYISRRLKKNETYNGKLEKI